ncbi:MAG: hypothetical protein V3574_02955 [Candidatus Moraniibacteriota bacterium]
MKKKIYTTKLEKIFVILSALRALSDEKGITRLDAKRDQRLLGNMPAVLEGGLAKEVSPPERKDKNIRSFRITPSGKEVLEIIKTLKKFKELDEK